MKRALKVAGFTNPLIVLEDGQQAIDYFRGTGNYADRGKYPLPALAFIDINLPLRNGIQVLEYVQGIPELANIIMVVLTSSNLQSDLQRAYRAGANSYVVKPPTRDKLMGNREGVQTLLGGSKSAVVRLFQYGRGSLPAA